MNRTWVEPDKRDQVVDFVRRWAEKTSVPVERILKWLELSVGKFYDWCQRYGQVNHHNGKVPRISAARLGKATHPGFPTVVPAGGIPAAHLHDDRRRHRRREPVQRLPGLAPAGRLARYPSRSSRKGNGFDQPLKPHEHWHIDIAHINIHGTFYYLCAVLDGASRYMVNWTLRESMREPEVEILPEQAKEKFPRRAPIISDNGPQFIAKDFKEFIRISGMTHVRTSPYYPQSNGKLERWNQSIKSECIRPGTPLSLDQALELVGSMWTITITNGCTVRLDT
ncbi:MAG: DDE-type integrase/transposase/recombinase [Bryobacteraceae bacterium]